MEENYNWKKYIFVFCGCLALFLAGYLYGTRTAARTENGTSTNAGLSRAKELAKSTENEISGATKHVDGAASEVSRATVTSGEIKQSATSISKGIDRSSKIIGECQDLNERAEQIVDRLVSSNKKGTSKK